ncbi:LON peptidase N-terminal domain and RING finger protein 3 [Nosema granulosis]|uniref:LON peptidase N-terminal domain and RING finger protein 3 n=1 Tax=Nosema granulosis TaxID=83296 RepID=A0A9P6GV97_9MICR|nr:LON peptidase N-terminal domain and RING finger protein 3 [Nosema granulosis]
MFPRSIVVLKDKDGGMLPKNISHIICKYTGDCPICLQYFYQPVISFCEHVYCKECIYESLEFSVECPICKKEISQLFKVDLHIKEEISEYICLKLLCDADMNIKNVSEYINYPYQKIYYSQDIQKKCKTVKKRFSSNLYVPNKDRKNYFYQSADGQPYFLDNQILSSIIRREGIKGLPRYVYGKIEEIKEVVFAKERFKTLSHLDSGSIIYIIKIYTNEV